MEGLVKGDIVVLPFPFSDLSAVKRRPALVIAKGEYSDIILCQITSKAKKDVKSVVLPEKDFCDGSLKITSYARPKRIFTCDSALVLYKVCRIKKEKIKEVEDIICSVMRE